MQRASEGAWDKHREVRRKLARTAQEEEGEQLQGGRGQESSVGRESRAMRVVLRNHSKMKRDEGSQTGDR